MEARIFDKLQAVALAALGVQQRRTVPLALEDPMIALEPHVAEAERSSLRSQRERRSGSECASGVVMIPFGDVAPPGFVDAATAPMLQV